MISCRSDLFQYHQKTLEQERLKDDINEYPLTSLEDNPKINAVLKEASEQMADSLEHSWEAYGVESEFAESSRMTGFGGGWKVEAFVVLSYMTSSGSRPNDKAFSEHMDRAENEAYKEAQESFITEHAEDLKRLKINPKTKKGLDKINYHDLYAMNEGPLAESLSETETSHMDQNQYTIYFSIDYYAPNSRHRDEADGLDMSLPMIEVEGGCRGSYEALQTADRFTFATMTELRTQLTKCMEIAKEKLN